MRAARLIVLLCAAWVALCAPPGDAHAQKPEPGQADIAKAKQHYQEARDHQDRGEYSEAAQAYLSAYALYPDAEFLFNVGEVYRLGGDKRRAVEYFEKYLNMDPNGRGSTDARASVAALRSEIEAEDAAAARKRAEEDDKQGAAHDPGTTTTQTADASSTLPPSPTHPAYPGALVLRPIQLLAGQVEAGGEVQVFSGPNDDWDQQLGSWMGLVPHVRYGITDTIQVGLQPLLLALKPSSSDFDESPSFGGLMVSGQYLFHESVSARIDAGSGVRGRLMSSPYLPPIYPAPLYDTRTFGFRAGASVKKSVQGRIALSAEPSLVVQMDSTKDHEAGCSEDDEYCVMTAIGLHLPIAAHYQVAPTVALGVRTGIFTGSELQVDPEEGATYPLLAEGLITLVGGALDVGLRAGFASLLRPEDGPDLGETTYLGLFASWRNK